MKEFKGPKRQRGFIGSLISAGAGLLGASKQRKHEKAMLAQQAEAQKFKDQSFGFGFGGGQLSGDSSTFNFNPEMQAIQSQLQGGFAQQLGGGLFNDPGLQAALAGNNIAGAAGQADLAFQQQAGNQAFGQLGGLAQTAGGLGQGLAAQFAQGPQDFSGGLQGGLLGQGFANQLAAGDQSALFQQSLDTQRQAATQGGLLDQAINKLQNRQFATGRLGSTGGSQETTGFLDSLARQDLGFQNNAFGQAQQQAQFLGQLGGQQIGQGQQFLGQNLGQFNQLGQQAGQFLGQAGAFERQGFGQGMAALQQNQAAGMGRLQAAQGLLGFGGDLQAQQIGLGIQQGDALSQINRLGLDTVLGLRGTEASRISGASGPAFAPQMNSGAGGFIAGLGQSLGKGVDQFFANRKSAGPKIDPNNPHNIPVDFYGG
jgi:hypothetical protein